MSVHSLAVAVLLCLAAAEGYGLTQEFRWQRKHLIVVPFTVFVWWLVLTILL